MSHSPSARPLSAGQLTGQADTHLVSHQQHLLHRDMQPSFIQLQQAAALAGFDLQIASAFRPFERQLLIWNNKFSGSRPLLDSNSQPIDASQLSELEKIHAIMRWSALPGASRHHWGTDVDVYAANCLPNGTDLQLEPWEYAIGGHQAGFSVWLNEHMNQFGFYLPYAEDRNGVAVEPWHISYYPVSRHLLQQLTPKLLYHTLNANQIAGKSQILANLGNLYSKYIENICEV
ncbi:M15 family metallopeptidase [Photobacterium chitinilyticum]|uniref:D-alanyl-D-alanine carboxypeptidase family protein n=1 Tax=Photobacterium chitinilyticum TaxID=2485123 RepID=A0A444JTU6_9GAMM|nr:M15 family metallopeptidase [Photobacterium chitinilyticum]RWX56486.1 D-alanyl-D-alanine carboxypeptidase family protein [Photobacterium chitinilyticum]